MLGIAVQLAISWMIIWLFEKQNLGVLGLSPTKKRLLDFAIFFIITAICASSEFILKMLLTNQQWEFNSKITAFQIFEGIKWNMFSVLYEELIFRGVIFYILIKRLGAPKAIIISAIAFGIYHWFSHGVIGNPTQMAITFVITGTMGLLLAYAYAKTFSLYIPIAIHFGWNLTHIFIFSSGLIGNGIFIPESGSQFRTDSYFIFFTVLFLPMVMALLINYLILRRRRQVEDVRGSNPTTKIE